MAEEIQEAVQIIRTAYDGIDLVLKISGGAVGQAKKALDFFAALLEHEKTLGKTDMRKLLMKGGDLQVFQFDAQDLRKVRKMAKKYGILYSMIPVINKKDGKREIIFHTEAVPRVNMIIQKLKFGRLSAVDDYLKSEDGKKKDEALSSFFKKKAEMSRHFGMAQKDREDSPAQNHRSRELAGRMQAAAVQDQDKIDITISRKLVEEENEHAVKTRVPGTWGDEAAYLWIEKSDIVDIHAGRTILTFLERDREYQLYASDNKAAAVMRGNDLYERCYDRVSAEVRRRYQEAGRKAAAGRKAVRKKAADGKKLSGRKRGG